MTTPAPRTGISRRQTLTAATTLGVAAPLLAACGASDSDGGGSSAGSSDSAAAGEKLGPASDVPVGGGTIYTDQKVVVTQPSKGEFKGFSAVCTHQGCLVSTVADGTINCTCHGSQFSIDDGSVVTGPATTGLSTVDVEDKSGQITTA